MRLDQAKNGIKMVHLVKEEELGPIQQGQPAEFWMSSYLLFLTVR